MGRPVDASRARGSLEASEQDLLGNRELLRRLQRRSGQEPEASGPSPASTPARDRAPAPEEARAPTGAPERPAGPAPTMAPDTAEQIRASRRRARERRRALDAREETEVEELSPAEQAEAVCEAAYPVSDEDRRLYERVSSDQAQLADPRTGFCADMEGRGGPLQHALREVGREAIREGTGTLGPGHDGEIRPGLPSDLPDPGGMLPGPVADGTGVIGSLENMTEAASSVDEAMACAGHYGEESNQAMYRRMAIEEEIDRSEDPTTYGEVEAIIEHVERSDAARQRCYQDYLSDDDQQPRGPTISSN